MGYLIVTRLFQTLAGLMIRGVKPKDVRPDEHPGKSAPRALGKPPVELPAPRAVQSCPSVDELHKLFKDTGGEALRDAPKRSLSEM